MTEFIIEDNVPIPNRKRGGGGRKAKYPTHLLEVGQSFFIPDAPKGGGGYYATMSSTFNRRYAPKRFVQRAEKDGLRIWRVE